MVVDVGVQPLAGKALDKRTQGNEIQITVHVVRAWRILQRVLEHLLQPLVPCAVHLVQRYPRFKSGSVREQLPDGDLFLAVGGKFRDVLRDRIVKIDFSLVVQLHHCGRCKQFADGRQVKNCVRTHRHGIGHGRKLVIEVLRSVSVRLFLYNDAATSDEDDSPRHDLVLNRRFNLRVNGVERRLRHASGRRRALVNYSR